MVAPLIAAGVIAAGADILGGYLSGERAEKAADKAYKRAKEFAQTGIQWKVKDANAAGINPYFALGAPTATYSDSGIGGEGGVGQGIANAGQSLARAAMANNGPVEKTSAALAAATLERAGLENDYLRTKIAAELRLLNQPGTPPAVIAPIKGDRLGGASVYGRDSLGNAFYVPPGWSAEKFADEFGDVLGEGYGFGRGVVSAADLVSQGQASAGSWLPPGSGAAYVWDYLSGNRR